MGVKPVQQEGSLLSLASVAACLAFRQRLMQIPLDKNAEGGLPQPDGRTYPRSCCVSEPGEIPYERYLRLENAVLSPEEAAEIIVRHFGDDRTNA